MISPTPFSSLLLYLVFVLSGRGILLAQAYAESNVHIVYLGERQHGDPKLVTNSHHEILATVVGSKELASQLMVYNYKHGFSGFAARLTKCQAKKLADVPGVLRVMPNSMHKLQTTRSWDFLGISSQEPNNLLHKSNMGDGVIIGVLDTGIWPESDAFRDEGLGPIPSHWKGFCESGEQFNSTTHCNKKVIGARWFVDGFLAEYGKPINKSEEFLSPRDANGHGTHVSSTACGSFVGNVSYKGLGLGTVRGGAPRARLAMYKVCWNVLGGQCAAADILKAFDEAIHDGVDVLSLSIGSSIPLFSDVDQRDGIATGSFHAVAKGITVVCAAANDGPFAQTVQHTAPWILTVAASTVDRSFATPITLGNNETIMGQAMFPGKEIGFAGLLYPEAGGFAPTSAGICEALSLKRSQVAGRVVLCFTSSVSRIAITRASLAVRTAGGVGVIIAKTPGDVLFPCSNDFPCIEVDIEAGTQILYYIRATRSPMVKLSPSTTLVGNPLSAKVAYFSSRGPNSVALAILKPDIAAPGVNILAATSPLNSLAENGYAMLSGTSMSAPHVAGIVALLKALQPDWSPAAFKSVLVTTGRRTNQYGLPIIGEGFPRKLADSFDFGGGIVNPNCAANPGLVYNTGISDYVCYLCAMDYNNSAISQLTGQLTVCPSKKPSILDVNLPSITIPCLKNYTTLRRMVTNVGPTNSVYRAVIEHPLGSVISVTPNILYFNSWTKTIPFAVTVSSTRQMNSGFYFGSLTWTDAVHAVRTPVSVQAVSC